MRNLVEEVLQAAVGNHFRDKLQSISAVDFIEKRQELQVAAFQHIAEQLNTYDVETRGVYIQDVILPEQLVTVLTEREIANQQVQTLKKKQEAEMQRVDTERAKGTADQQAELAKSTVGIEIEKNKAQQKIETGRGEAEFLKLTGEAAGAKIRSEGLATADSIKAQGLAQAEGMAAQQEALGKENVMIVNVIRELVKTQPGVFPKIVTIGGGGGLEGIGGGLLELMSKLSESKPASTKPAVQ
jgi:regulator of protease activity HflC (stomatin/prohibitin superfamily)